MLTRLMVVLALGHAGCEAVDGMAMQAVAGPGGVQVVVPTIGGAPIADQLAISWTASTGALDYCIFQQSTPNGPFSSIACMVGSGGGAPPTTYTAAGLSGTTQYCYAIAATFSDGTTSDPGPQGCGLTAGPHTIAIDGIAFGPITSATTVSHQSGCTFTGGLGVRAPLMLEQGRTVTAVRFYVTDNTAGPTTIQGALETRSPNGDLQANITAGSSGSGSAQVLTTVRPTSISTGRGYFLEVFYFSGSATSNISFAEIDYN